MFKDLTDTALEAMRQALANSIAQHATGATSDFAVLEMIEAEQASRLPGGKRERYETARVALQDGDLAVHTINGRPIDNETNPGTYGRTHDMDCPGCQGTSFTASPRSETYWAS